MDWTQFATFIIANMFFTLTLWLWSRSESRQDHRQIVDLIASIKDEMKDFHGRLERQDAEFRGRMEKQDAEFKAHIMYFHDERNKK